MTRTNRIGVGLSRLGNVRLGVIVEAINPAPPPPDLDMPTFAAIASTTTRAVV